MKNAIVLSIFVWGLLSCKNDTSKINSDQQEFTEENMKIFFNDLPAKELDDKHVVNYKGFAAQSISDNMLDQLTTQTINECPTSVVKISDLNSGSGFQYYKFASDKAAEAKAMGFGGSIDKKEILIIKDYVRYQLLPCEGGLKKFGIGLRCFIHVKKLKGSLSATLANIAGSVQLNKGEAIYSLKSLGFGIGGNLIAEGLEGQGDYNVENFSKVDLTFKNVLKTLNDSTKITISPVELPNQ